MYPASRESAAFDGKAMKGYARPVPNKLRRPQRPVFLSWVYRAPLRCFVIRCGQANLEGGAKSPIAVAVVADTESRVV